MCWARAAEASGWLKTNAEVIWDADKQQRLQQSLVRAASHARTHARTDGLVEVAQLGGSLDIAMLPRVAMALLCGCDCPGGGEPIRS